MTIRSGGSSAVLSVTAGNPNLEISAPITVAGGATTTGAIVSTDGANNAFGKLQSVGSNSVLTLNTNIVSNNRFVQFSYGATPTNLWKLGFSGYFPTTWVGFSNDTSGGGIMATGNNNLLIGNSTTDMSGTYGLKMEGTTDATSFNTGSFLTAGGGSFGKALWIGGLARINGTLGVATTTPWGQMSLGTHNLAIATPSFVIASSSTGVSTST
jgi:hypothetical protein